MTGAASPDLAVLARQAAFLLVQGHPDQAADLCNRVRAADPNLNQFTAFTDLLLWARPREQIYPLIRSLVDCGFANSRSFDLLAAAAIWAGDRDTALSLTDPDRFLYQTSLHWADDPDLPPLTQELTSGLDRYEQPGDRSIRKGWRRNHLEQAAAPILRRMFDRLWHVALDYIDRLPDEPGNPFLRARPARLSMRAWSVVSGAETHHLSHLHATSWVNGVYYVAVPPEVAHNTANRPGWLRVGPATSRGFTADSGWGERWICPEPGLVVLMPSHFSHETVPTGCDGQRICVAFELYSTQP